MDYFEQVVRLSRWVGVVPVVKITKSRKGEVYQMLKRATMMMVVVLQIGVAVLMTHELHSYMIHKTYYTKLRVFQVNTLMYFEVAQSLLTVISSVLFRYPRMETLLIRSRILVADIGKSQTPFVIKYTGHFAVLSHTLLTIYRIGQSKDRIKLMIPFWIGMCPVAMVPAVLTANLWLVNIGLKEVNSELSKMVKQSSKASRCVQHQLGVLLQKQVAAVNLFSVVKECFGMDVLIFCFVCLTKTTFILYHMYWNTVSDVLGTNTMVGGLTGSAQIGLSFICILLMATLCDMIYNKNIETQLLLLLLMKNKGENVDPELKMTVVLGSVTYVFVLIQFQAVKF